MWTILTFNRRSPRVSGGQGPIQWSTTAAATISTVRVKPIPRRLTAVMNLRRNNTFTAIFR